VHFRGVLESAAQPFRHAHERPAFWAWSGATWAATKLTGYTLKSCYEVAGGDSYSGTTGTTFTKLFDYDGRLSQACAVPGNASGAASQNFDERFSFLTDGSGKSLWNLQSVQSGVVDASGDPVGRHQHLRLPAGRLRSDGADHEVERWPGMAGLAPARPSAGSSIASRDRAAKRGGAVHTQSIPKKGR